MPALENQGFKRSLNTPTAEYTGELDYGILSTLTKDIVFDYAMVPTAGKSAKYVCFFEGGHIVTEDDETTTTLPSQGTRVRGDRMLQDINPRQRGKMKAKVSLDRNNLPDSEDTAR